MRLNKWIAAFIGTGVIVAVIFRVPQLKKLITGSE
jgi:hypothetical protein